MISVPVARCFNPCCLGLGNEALPSGRDGRTHPHVSILVVLDWGMRQQIAVEERRIGRRFNPCCLGLGNEATAQPAQRAAPI